MSEHTMHVTIPHGDPDIGAECDVAITFTYRPGTPFRMYKRNGDPADPPDPPEVEFVEAQPLDGKGKPFSYGGAFADLEFAHLQDIARDWLETDEGFNQACDCAEQEQGPDPDWARDRRIDDEITRGR